MFNIIYFYANYGYYLNFAHFRNALSKVANVHFFECPEMLENMPSIYDAYVLAKEHNADAVVIGVNNTVHRAVFNMDKVMAIKVMFSDDPHNWLERQAKWMNKAKIDIMLMMNYGRWYGKPEDYPIWWKHPFKLNSERRVEIYGGEIPIADKYQRLLSYPCTFIQFPESVSIDFFKDRGYERTIDTFNSGSFSSISYPLRCKIYDILSRQPDINCGIKPSFAYNWDEFADVLARSKMLTEGIPIFGYTSQRFVQAMASKTLVVSSLPYDNVDNHFIPDKNFVELKPSGSDVLEKVIYYKTNESERKRLIENAYQTILKYHTCEIRAQQMIDILKNRKV